MTRAPCPQSRRECYRTLVMRFVFVMDPVSTVIVDEDTSFALMLEAQRPWPPRRPLSCERRRAFEDVNESLLGRVSQAAMQDDPDAPITLGEPGGRRPGGASTRCSSGKTRPFDRFAYLWLTLVLDHLDGVTLVVNSPRGLREANEKLYAHHFSDRRALRRS